MRPSYQLSVTVSDELRRLGQLAPKAPPTHQLGLGNPRYRSGARS